MLYENMIQIKNVVLGYKESYRKRIPISPPLNLNLQEGDFTALIGLNGSGKSTLLKTIAGLQTPLKGHILLFGKKLHTLSIHQIAALLSLVFNEKIRGTTHLSVYELVATSRYIHTNWLGILQEKDIKQIQRSLSLTNTLAFVNRSIEKLSDGERQKVMIARALAQETPLILLDEPTVHLDIPATIGIMNLLKHLATQEKKTILIATHHLDIAIQMADKLWLINPNGSISCGIPEEMILNGQLERSFSAQGIYFDKEKGTFKASSLSSNKEIVLKGNKWLCRWITNALERKGFSVSKQKKDAPSIEASFQKGKPYYACTFKSSRTYFNSIENLLKYFNNKMS